MTSFISQCCKCNQLKPAANVHTDGLKQNLRIHCAQVSAPTRGTECVRRVIWGDVSAFRSGHGKNVTAIKVKQQMFKQGLFAKKEQTVLLSIIGC